MKKRTVEAKAVISDIKAGLTDAELMKKYKLSARGLNSAFTKLVKLKCITQEEVDARQSGDPAIAPPTFEDTVSIDEKRSLPRYRPRQPIPVFETTNIQIYETKDLAARGRIRDINEKGVGIIGLPSKVDEVKTLAIVADEFVEVDPVVFDAVCKWTKKDENGEIIGGFEITRISKQTAMELKKLVQIVLHGGSDPLF